MSFLARVTYTSNGSTPTFSFSFPYILQSHIKAFVNGVEDTSITFPTTSSVTLSSTPANGATVVIQRFTPSDTRLTDFQDGSVLTSADLDQSADQNFYIAQETSDNVSSNLSLNNSNLYDANNNRIINVANPVDAQDAVTKHYLENTWLSTSDKANINTLAPVSTQIGLLGTSAVITDLNTLGTADVVSDMNTLATADVVSDLNTLATADVVSDMNTLATSSNVTNMNTLAANITGVNSFAERYRVSTNDPTSNNDAGDLAFVTSSSKLRYYNGSAWVDTLDTSSLNNLNASNLTSGTVPTARLSNIPNASLTNSAITINGTSVSLGGTITTAGDIEGVTAGTGLSGGGNSGTVTLNIDSTVATLSGTQILTNKTIDANGTGNSITNLEVADLASGVLDTNLSTVSSNDDTIASAKAIKSYVDTQVSTVPTGDITSVVAGTGLSGGATSGDATLSINSATHLSSNDTDDLSEGSTNLYYTNARADARVNLQTGSNLDLSNKSTTNLSEGTNLYYTDARFDTRLAAKDTDNLTEGSSNLYFTNARADARINLQTGSNLSLSNKSTSDLSEGSNLYYTDERVDDRVNGLLTAGSNITLTYNDAGNSLTIAATDTDNSIPFAIALG